jgi:hypothetical protein
VIVDPTDTVGEPRWLEQVGAWADRGGWLVYHTWDSRHSRPGFPDLVLVRRDWLRFAELKSNSGQLGNPQKNWQQALAEVRHVETSVWRPREYQLVRNILLGGD